MIRGRKKCGSREREEGGYGPVLKGVEGVVLKGRGGGGDVTL